MLKSKSNADLMRAWRKSRGLSTAEAGAVLGMSSRNVENIEQGRIRVDDRLTTIALKKMLEEKQNSA